MSLPTPNNFYCSQKFTWLSVDLEKRLSYSCCAAAPERLKIEWLKNNPGKLFDTPGLHQDRIDMLENRAVPSCQESCWKAESQGLSSRRTVMKSYKPVPLGIDVTTPQTLNIILGSTCNLTCSYCCKQFSSAWYRDLRDNGPYLDYENRYQLISEDHIAAKLSHRENQNSQGFDVIVDEISRLGPVQEVFITGGEPFLYNQFPDLLNKLDQSQSVNFFTGLGVDTKRLKNQIERIKDRKNIQIVVSAENCGSFYEFNRYGNQYTDFLINLQLLIDSGFSIKFNAVISNLTVHGILEFAQRFKDFSITYNFCNSPDFLGVNVLDDQSKTQLIDLLVDSQIPLAADIVSNLQLPCTDQQKENFSKFLQEFSSRRNLALDIFPSTMLQWLDIKDTHVV